MPMDRWQYRQFTMEKTLNPKRFVVKNASSGAVIGLFDLDFAPAPITARGTPLNRGYWQPVELFLSAIDLEAIEVLQTAFDAKLSVDFNAITAANNGMISNIDAYINSLNNRIATNETNVQKYAPLTGAAFTDARQETSPEGTDNSMRWATSEFVRNHIRQFPFPPKNVSGLLVSNTDKDLEIVWQDPLDFIFEEDVLSDWTGTKLVYQFDRYPNSVDDGTLLVDNTWRNQFEESPFTFTGTLGLTYFVQAFPYNSKGLYNAHVSNRVKARLTGVFVITGLSRAREGLTASKDGAGNVLFAGGRYYDAEGSDTLSTVDKYDVMGNRTTLSLGEARFGLASATDGWGNVLIGGGFITAQFGEASKLVDKISVTGTRTSLELSTRRAELAASADADGSVLFGGGTRQGGSYNTRPDATVDKFNMQGTRSTYALSLARYDLAASMDGYGRAVFGGGLVVNEVTLSYAASDIVDRFSPDGTRTSLLLSEARGSFAATTDFEGNVYFGGGRNTDHDHSSVVDKFSSTGTRTTLLLSSSRDRLSAATAGDMNVLFIGGYSGRVGVIDVFSPSGARTTLIPLVDARRDLAAATDGWGNVLMGGGYYNNLYESSAAVEKYFI